jgi:serine/threonine protein kinase
MINYETNDVTLIDFGLTSKYLSQHSTLIPFKSTGNLIGTPLYASNNALLGKEISRRDDIESMI